MTLEENILTAFLDITNESVIFVNEWRQGNKEILTKININGQSDVVTALDRRIEENAKTILNNYFSLSVQN